MTASKTRTAEVDKPHWLVQFECATALVAEGCSRAATVPLHKALELNPALTTGWRLLGDILMVSGDFLGARHAYDRRICSMIRDARLRAAAEAITENRLDDAERDLVNLLSYKPAAATAARHLLGECLRRQNRLTDAEQALRRCLEDEPEFFHARQSLALTLFGARRFSESLEELDRLLARDPTDNRCLLMKAAALSEIDRHDEAAEVTATVLSVFPDQTQVWLVFANGQRTLGRIGASTAAFLKCVELDPRCAEAYWSLANLKTYRFTAGQRAAMEVLLARDDVAAKERVELHFALGKALEDDGDYDGAFNHYVDGNALEHVRRPYDPESTTVRVRTAKALFTADFFAARADCGATEPGPVFIVGLPRSGSTLVEQILASHPAVEGTRELPDLPNMAAEIHGYPESLASLSQERFASLGREYLRRTKLHRILGRPRFTDKTPANFFHIGLIRLILPNAKVVDVRRHPLACCVSNFTQHFGGGFESSYNLRDLGRYYADYVDLMAHYDEVLPGEIHRVVYEDLVADTEGGVRGLLAFLNLPFDPTCLRFFENSRAVATPSSEQVRQPIFTDALDHWRKFDGRLNPLKQALGPAWTEYTPAAQVGAP